MAFGALSDSKYRLALSSRAMTQQQPANFESDNSFKKDGHFQAVATSLLNASSGDFPASVCKIAHTNEGKMSKRTNPILVNETENSQFSMLSSLVPEGSSSVSTSVNSDFYSYLNVPPLPLPTLSSCSSTSGASNFGLESSQTRKRKQHQGGGELDRGTATAVHKNARLEVEQEATQRRQNVLRCPPNLDGGVYSRRIMQYMYHLRHRPSDNDIAFWKELVAEYFAPCAKKRWCLSSYHNVERYAPGVFPRAAYGFQIFVGYDLGEYNTGKQFYSVFLACPSDTWQCDLCGSKSGRGFEADLEALPRLNKIMFESGVIDELLYLDLPHELTQFSGLMTLEYGKAVQVSVYEQFRIVHEGKLRIIFTSDLKILSWEFCAWHHEELLPRNLVAPQISKLIRTVQKYQNYMNCSGSVGVSPHDLQANCNVFLVAGCQLIRNLEFKPVDNLGFSKRYVRCLQISEIINSMKDLMSLSMNKNIGPIESLRCYSQENRWTNPWKDEQQNEESDHWPSVGKGKLMSTCLSENNEIVNSSITGCEEASVSAGYFTQLLKQNSLNSNASKVMQQKTEHIKNLSVCKQKTENSLIQKLLQEMINDRRTSDGGSEKWSSNTMADSAAATRGTAIDEYKVAFNGSMASQAILGNVTNSTVGKFSTFTAATSNVDPCEIYGHGSLSRREQHLSEAIHNMISRFDLKQKF